MTPGWQGYAACVKQWWAQIGNTHRKNAHPSKIAHNSLSKNPSWDKRVLRTFCIRRNEPRQRDTTHSNNLCLIRDAFTPLAVWIWEDKDNSESKIEAARRWMENRCFREYWVELDQIKGSNFEWHGIAEPPSTKTNKQSGRIHETQLRSRKKPDAELSPKKSNCVKYPLLS